MDRGARAFEFIETIETVTTEKLFLDELANVGRFYGLEYFAIAGIPSETSEFRRYSYARNWPIGWYEHYLAAGHLAVDPVVKQLRASSRPFLWTETGYGREPTSRAARMMNEAGDFGIRTGFSVPIHTGSGDLACVSFATEQTREVDAEDRAALHLIAIYAQLKIHDLLGDRGRSEQPARLTPREKEVLAWCSIGKTTRDISDILAISDATVETHMANIIRKLDALTRTQAVAKALRMKIIT